MPFDKSGRRGPSRHRSCRRRRLRARSGPASLRGGSCGREPPFFPYSEDAVIRFETGIHIDRPREDVFEVVSDPETYPRWNSAVRAVRAAADGSGFRLERELPSGRAENRLEVVSAIAPEEVVIRASDGPTPFTYRYRLRDADGGTDLALAAEVELEGVPRLLEPVAGRAVRRGVEENFSTLKNLLER